MPDFPPAGETARSAKIALRSHILTHRQKLSASERGTAAAAVQVAVTGLFPRFRPTTVAAYAPVGAEPGGADLPEALVRALPTGARLLLPLLLPDGDLDWALYAGPRSLAAGPRGLRQPTGAPLGVDAIRDAELVIVPALAVGRTGVRMGRGGGSYDRALARAAGRHSVALLHDGEVLDHVPAEPHDRTVDAVITPARGCSAARSGVV